MRRIAFAAIVAALSCAVAHAEEKVLRVPFLIAETNFDPAGVSDLYSNAIVEEIRSEEHTSELQSP